MTDKDVQRILDEKHPIAAVLLNRGGWISQTRLTVKARFAPTEEDAALWQVDLLDGDGTILHSVYVKAESIVGISCRRHTCSPRTR